MRTPRWAAAALAALLGISLAGPATAPPAAAAPSEPAGTGQGYWSAEGDQLVDADGDPVRMTGINWFGSETDTFAPHGLWERNLDSMVEQMAGLGFNTIRLPYSNEALDAGSVPNGIDFSVNPELEGLSGVEILDEVIASAGEHGMRVLLDRHRPSASSQSALWYTDAHPQSEWIADWKMLAERYAGNPTVIGADLHNEPHSTSDGTGACWGCGDPARDWRLAAEEAGNAILEVNPDWLIVVEGVDCVAGTGAPECGWWGGNLSGAAEYPVRLSNPDKLVYSAHEYATSVAMQDWFEDPDFPANMPALWDHFWGYLENEDRAPVLLGEFGTTLQDSRDQVWLQDLMSYLGQGTSGIDFTYWSWNPNSGDTGGILQNDWRTVDQDKYSYVEPYLSPTSPGDGDGTGGGDGDGDGDGGGGDTDPPAGTACTVDYSVANSWDGGFTADVVLTNSGDEAITDWTLTWTAPDGVQVTSGWGADVSQSGDTVTAAAPDWASTLDAGASASIGFQATGPASPQPEDFRTGGTSCSGS
ncbi:cellulase family glycosylhydrolase [Streptomonospora sp. PA3]|uniref:cellulase family glycosylhydrolase n=1 Tax=Streptomonospora sp. PA3 TaxID=2607326 RepID=UPI0012DD93DB|nr:cellulase family glycosylhydrolase [Streptomonospora sp. PA3]MUL41379.1 cellulase family glycosylhydrolase [Streptomonospora sp. PA3]